MEFNFPNPKTKNPRKRRQQRFFEVIPGLLAWSALIGMFVFSFWLPVWAAVFIIVFDIYWIYRTVFVTSYSIVAYRRLQKGVKIDWWKRCQNITKPERYSKNIEKRIKSLRGSLVETPRPPATPDTLRKSCGRATIAFRAGWGVSTGFNKRRIIKKEIKNLKKYHQEVKGLIKIKDQIWGWKEIIHVVLLPTVGEPAEIIEPALEALKKSNFPKKQIIILLATEEREPEEFRTKKVNYLKSKFKGVFRDFIVTTHKVAAGEMKCKASNAKYAAKRFQEYLDKNEIDYKKVIFSNFDCDSVCHKEYFAALTYAYITEPKRLQRAYQPLPMYHNNLWDTNAFVRVIVTSSSFWHMYQSTRREMVTFSSHSEPFDTLVKLDFWPVNMISEDSIIYWKGFSYFHGDYEVKPIYLPISLDAVLAETYWKTIKNQYKQKRRWAYGIENFPVTMRAIWPDRKISFFTKLRRTFEMLEGHFSWATTSFLLAFLGWLPLILGGPEFNEQVLAHNLPFITRFLMTLAMSGLVISMFLSMLRLPPKPKKYSKWKYLNMFFQWFLVPIIALLVSIPALDSQTRIMTKRYFGEFWVTEKIRKKD